MLKTIISIKLKNSSYKILINLILYLMSVLFICFYLNEIAYVLAYLLVVSSLFTFWWLKERKLLLAGSIVYLSIMPRQHSKLSENIKISLNKEGIYDAKIINFTITEFFIHLTLWIDRKKCARKALFILPSDVENIRSYYQLKQYLNLT